MFEHFYTNKLQCFPSDNELKLLWSNWFFIFSFFFCMHFHVFSSQYCIVSNDVNSFNHTLAAIKLFYRVHFEKTLFGYFIFLNSELKITLST